MKNRSALLLSPIKHLVAVGVLCGFASAANALVPVDGWQIDTGNTDGTLVPQLFTNIGHLNMSGGDAIVEQEVNGAFVPFAGARFKEFGAIYSVTYTPENCVGLCDSGSPALLMQGGSLLELTIEFTGLTGTVSSYDAGTGEIEYMFDAGVGSVALYGDTGAGQEELATFSVINPSGGDLGDFNGIGGQSQGQSTISALVITSMSDVFRDALGDSFDDEIALGNLFALVVTTNQITQQFGNPAPCTFAGDAVCVSGSVQSVGTFDLLTVPVPAPLALLGLGLMVMGGMRRKSRA